MGKKQHQKDKLYITTKEWQSEWGGKKEDDTERAKFRRLPFNYCSLSLQPFEHPLCTQDGVIFDLLNIIPFLKKYGKNPANGEPMTAKDLIKLHFYKNSSGQYHCPVMYKVFTENSHIVAIKTTGNVFSYDAVDELNLKTKNMHDLLNNETFSRKDIITLQDPSNLDKFNISNFFHVKNSIQLVDEDEEAARKNPLYTIRKVNLETESTLKELEQTYKEPAESYLKSSSKADKTENPTRFQAHYSTGVLSGSFTSTSQDRTTAQVAATLSDDVVRYERVQKLKKKGYVRLTTSKGDLNLELHCEMVPKTCENFLRLCNKEYYNGTTFHRLIKNFMVQGGDPTGTGKGGESAWGQPFKDEFKPNLSHSGRGVLSMANSGKNTNNSQFFITFRSCQHLDNKHSVFGRLVGGLDALAAIEAVTTDDQDRPQEEITIVNAVVFVNPFDEVDEQLEQERLSEEKKAEEEHLLQKQRKVAKDIEDKPKVYRPGIGKYIPGDVSKRSAESSAPPSGGAPSTKKKKASAGFGDFAAW